MTSSRPNLRGSSCGAIPSISAIIERPLIPPPIRLSCRSHSSRDGGYDFAIHPDLRADGAPVIWLAHLNPGAVLVAPAPEPFRSAGPVGVLPPTFARRAADGEHWIINDGYGRLPALLIGGTSPDLPAAVVIPFDTDFATRTDAALRLWRLLAGRRHRRPPDRLTPQRRHRLGLSLRALDARLAGEPYRVIAAGLFSDAHIPAGRGWKTHDLRNRTIRVVRAGMELMQGGYLDLLRE